MIKQNVLLLITTIFILSCSSKQEPEKKVLNFNDTEKNKIEQFSKNLRNSLNKYEYKFFVTSWDKPSFDAHFSKETKIAKNILNNYLDETVRKEISHFQLDFVDRLAENNGTIKLTKINHRGLHSVISFAVSYDIFVDFIQFRVELVNNEPKLTDIYSFRSDDWISNNLKRDLKLNIKYKAGSTERKQANIALIGYKKALESKDFLSALMSLNSIPKSHVNDFTTLQKLSTAININEDFYKNELDKNAVSSKNLCISYLYASFYQDTTQLNIICEELTNSIGECDEINKLQSGEKFWQ